MKNRTVGIILLNWNSANTTIRCIESILYMGINKEIVICIVDNNSRLEDFEILEDYVNSLEIDILLIKNNRNIGFGSGNNIAFKYFSKYDLKYLWLLNNDTLVEKDSLIRLINYLEKNTDVGVVGSKLIYLDNGKTQALGGGYVNLNFGIGRHIIDVKDLGKLNYVTAASMLIRKEIMDLTGGFDEDIFLYWEDVELCLRIKQLGWKLGVALDSIVYHEESSSSKKLGARRQFYFTQGLDTVLRKHTEHGVIYRSILHTLRAMNKIMNGQSDESKEIIRYIRNNKNV